MPHVPAAIQVRWGSVRPAIGTIMVLCNVQRLQHQINILRNASSTNWAPHTAVKARSPALHDTWWSTQCKKHVEHRAAWPHGKQSTLQVLPHPAQLCCAASTSKFWPWNIRQARCLQSQITTQPAKYTTPCQVAWKLCRKNLDGISSNIISM
jgi:hypothetical protein